MLGAVQSSELLCSGIPKTTHKEEKVMQPSFTLNLLFPPLHRITGSAIPKSLSAEAITLPEST